MGGESVASFHGTPRPPSTNFERKHTENAADRPRHHRHDLLSTCTIPQTKKKCLKSPKVRGWSVLCSPNGFAATSATTTPRMPREFGNLVKWIGVNPVAKICRYAVLPRKPKERVSLVKKRE